MQSHYGNSEKPHIQATLQWSWSHSLQSEDLVLLKYHQHKLLVLLIFFLLLFEHQPAKCNVRAANLKRCLDDRLQLVRAHKARKSAASVVLARVLSHKTETLMKTNTSGLCLW